MIRSDAQPGSSTHDRRFVHEYARTHSRTTVAYAKWIHSAADEPDHLGQTLATRNPDVIRTWTEARGGVPATAESLRSGRLRTLCLDFPHDGGGDEGRPMPIAWSDWLDAFEERDLVFLYQETLANGRQSNFFRLDIPEPEDRR